MPVGMGVHLCGLAGRACGPMHEYRDDMEPCVQHVEHMSLNQLCRLGGGVFEQPPAQKNGQISLTVSADCVCALSCLNSKYGDYQSMVFVCLLSVDLRSGLAHAVNCLLIFIDCIAGGYYIW